jgi:hypothetical protein
VTSRAAAHARAEAPSEPSPLAVDVDPALQVPAEMPIDGEPMPSPEVLGRDD